MARLGLLGALATKVSTWGPAWLRRLIVDICPLSTIQDMKGIVDIMDRTSSSLFSERETLITMGALADQTAGGKDILTLMRRRCFRLVYC